MSVRLYQTKSIMVDYLEKLFRSSNQKGLIAKGGNLNFSLVDNVRGVQRTLETFKVTRRLEARACARVCEDMCLLRQVRQQ